MKGKDELVELILLVLMGWFLFRCVFTDNVVDAGHKVFVKMGISDEIQRLDNYLDEQESDDLLLSRVKEVVKRAKEYMKRYNISPRDAVECAIRDIEKELERENG